MSAGVLESLRRAVLDGDEAAADAGARAALDAGVAPLDAIDHGLVAAIREAGTLWEEGEFFLPELVTAAQAMKAGMAVLQPALADGDVPAARGRVVIATVEGDIHDIGKTLVATLLAAHGFEVHDEGADVPVARLVERARATDADLICASALLTTTMLEQRALVDAVREAGLRCRVLVGGVPVTADWADEIGAAGYADSAVGAVERAQELIDGA